jgi:hypothetical protein
VGRARVLQDVEVAGLEEWVRFHGSFLRTEVVGADDAGARTMDSAIVA